MGRIHVDSATQKLYLTARLRCGSILQSPWCRG